MQNPEGREQTILEASEGLKLTILEVKRQLTEDFGFLFGEEEGPPTEAKGLLVEILSNLQRTHREISVLKETLRNIKSQLG